VPNLFCNHDSSDLDTSNREQENSTSEGCARTTSFPHDTNALNHADEVFKPPGEPTSTPTVTTPPTSPSGAFPECSSQQDSEPGSGTDLGLETGSFAAIPSKPRPRIRALHLEPLQEKEITLDLMQNKNTGDVGTKKSRKSKSTKPRSNKVATSHEVDDALSTVMGLAAPAMDRLELYYIYNPENINNPQQKAELPVVVSSSCLSL
jgi:hypothetical protein